MNKAYNLGAPMDLPTPARLFRLDPPYQPSVRDREFIKDCPDAIEYIRVRPERSQGLTRITLANELGHSLNFLHMTSDCLSIPDALAAFGYTERIK